MKTDESPEELVGAQFVSLTTFRKSGAGVATPVWAAFDDGCFYMFSAGQAGKMKRLRNSNKARLARCTGSGKLLGPWHDAQAEILTSSESIATALKALRAKYGFQMWITDLMSKLTGKYNQRGYIAVRLTGAPEES